MRMCACSGTSASRTCLVWRSRARFCSLEAEGEQFGQQGGDQGGWSGGTSAACANSSTTASCSVRSGGRAEKTRLGRPETDQVRHLAISVLGIGHIRCRAT